MAAYRACRNAVRFSAIKYIKMDGLMFRWSVLQKEHGFRPDQIDHLYALPGDKLFAVIFTTFALFEQCLKSFKEKNDSTPLKMFAISALTQPQKRWVNFFIFNEYAQSADIIMWLNMRLDIDAANETSKVQLALHFELLLNDTDKNDSLYATPKVLSTSSQNTVQTASSDTVNTFDNQETVSTVTSKDSCTRIEHAYEALEQSSFSDIAVAGVTIEQGKDDNIIEEEVEAAMDISTSLKGNGKEGDNAEETGFESNDSRDLCAQDERCKFQGRGGKMLLPL
ncbi:hypothetical protein NDU88_002101 [Pleurodeles waltl]|uniref:Zinc finger CCHC domain-containing protein n=1 Tax=Pleurodeles waltl TaxID=8319 RepID=A0AAV7NG54_PLEWA|nr:hypothetical protein NDU88_002101 [Pleurodeles waltl]